MLHGMDERNLPTVFDPNRMLLKLSAAMQETGRTLDPVELVVAEQYAAIYCEAMRPETEDAPAAKPQALKVALEATAKLATLAKGRIEDDIGRSSRAKRAETLPPPEPQVVEAEPEQSLDAKIRLLRERRGAQ